VTALVVGAARSGVAVANHLVREGERVIVTDRRSRDELGASIEQLPPAAELRLGGYDDSLLAGIDAVYASPGVPWDAELLNQARARGIPVSSEIDLFLKLCPGTVVGITGTNGKTTTTALTGDVLAAGDRPVMVGGNIGDTVLDRVDEITPEHWVVLELSSFQLESTDSLELLAAAVLNLTPDHMDRYATLADYAAAKARIFAHAAVAVVNLDDPEVSRMPRPGQRRVGFSIARADADFGLVEAGGEPQLARRGVPLLPVRELRIPGRHNAANALAALALGEEIGLPLAPMLATLRRFAGLAHRSQLVAERRGVRYVDDSKGTNVGATLAAVAGLDGPLVLIAGGDGKGQDFTPLAAAFRGKVRHAVLIGRDRDRLATALRGVCTTEFASDMDAAVAAAARAAAPNDLVLLSPACASLDMFRDYAARGEAFAAAVRGLAP
jgi:UDP-N-acetylmuramoylalanine--D-glutamate ligase